MTERLLNPGTALLLVVDIQEKFVPVIADADRLIAKTKALIAAAKTLKLPILVSEQYVKGLGPTVPELREALPEDAVVREKTAFGCLGDTAIADLIHSAGRRQVIVCGLEAHVCVSQTVHMLIDAGFEAHVVEDALAARDPGNIPLAMRKMVQSGAIPACVEMVLFELMGHSRHPDFKTLQKLIK